MEKIRSKSLIIIDYCEIGRSSGGIWKGKERAETMIQLLAANRASPLGAVAVKSRPVHGRPVQKSRPPL